LHNFRLDPDLFDPALLYGDNQASIALSKNPKFHKRVKHIWVHYHLIRSLVDLKKIDLHYKSTSQMITDSLTKALPCPAGNQHREDMGLHHQSMLDAPMSGSVER
jgi:fructosamine-3-kinase